MVRSDEETDDPGTIDYGQGWNGATLQKTTNDTWTNLSTWDSTSLTKTDSLGSFPGGLGTKSIVLNAAGIAMFQDAADASGQGVGNDEVNIALNDTSSGNFTDTCKIASIQHATVAYRPKAIIVYTA